MKTPLLGAMVRALRCLIARDPSIFVAMFAAYVALTGISLALPGSAFDASPIYSVVRHLRLPEQPTGWTMLVNAGGLLWSLHPRASVAVRTAIGILTGAAWIVWGAMLAASAASAGFFSSTGSWTVLAATFVMVSTAGWIQHMPEEAA